MRDSLQSQLQFFPKRSLIIGDEAHKLGATRLGSSLPQEIKLRLALSATPERYFDKRGTERLFEYFGSVLEPEFTFWAEVEQEQASIKNLRRHLSTLQNQLDDIREQLKGSGDVNVSGLEKRLEEIEDKIIDLHREEQDTLREIEDCDAAIADLNKQIRSRN